MLPRKLSPSAPASSACASSVSSLPFSGSSPIESSRTSGSSTPSTSSAKTEPMCANWSRCSGRASAFAPAVEQDGRAALARDRRRRSRGADTPGSRRSSRRQAASIAPVFPAETTASACLRPTARQAATSELSGFARDGLGRLLVHRDLLPVVSTSSSPCVSRPAGPKRTGSIASARGLERARDDLLGRAVAAQGVDGDADGHARYERRAERLDLAPAVGPAGRAHAVRPLRLVAVRADVQARRSSLVLRAALVAAGLRFLLLGDGHGRRSIARGSERRPRRVAPKRSSRRRSWRDEDEVPV